MDAFSRGRSIPRGREGRREHFISYIPAYRTCSWTKGPPCICKRHKSGSPRDCTHLLHESRPVLQRAQNGIRNAGAQLLDGVHGVQTQRIVMTVHRHDEPLDRLHVTGPREIQFGRRLGQAAPATFICIFLSMPLSPSISFSLSLSLPPSPLSLTLSCRTTFIVARTRKPKVADTNVPREPLTPRKSRRNNGIRAYTPRMINYRDNRRVIAQ